MRLRRRTQSMSAGAMRSRSSAPRTSASSRSPSDRRSAMAGAAIPALSATKINGCGIAPGPLAAIGTLSLSPCRVVHQELLRKKEIEGRIDVARALLGDQQRATIIALDRVLLSQRPSTREIDGSFPEVELRQLLSSQALDRLAEGRIDHATGGVDELHARGMVLTGIDE